MGNKRQNGNTHVHGGVVAMAVINHTNRFIDVIILMRDIAANGGDR